MLYLSEDIRKIDDAKRYVAQILSLRLAPEQLAVVQSFSDLLEEGSCERYLSALERVIATTRAHRQMHLTCKSRRSGDHQAEELDTKASLQVNYPASGYRTEITTAYPWAGVRQYATLTHNDGENATEIYAVRFKHDEALRELERLPGSYSEEIRMRLEAIKGKR